MERDVPIVPIYACNLLKLVGDADYTGSAN